MLYLPVVEFLRNLTLGQYVSGDSWMHRLDPRVKLAIVLGLMVATFWLSHSGVLVLLSFITLIVGRTAGLSLTYLLRGLQPILPLLMLTLVFNAAFGPEPRFHHLSVPGMERGGLLSLRLIALVLSTTLLTLTTSPMRLCDGIESLLTPLGWIGVKPHEVALVFTIALRFVPTLALEAERIGRAQMARGAAFDRGGPIARTRALVALLVPLFTRAFQHADQLAVAMESRAYRGARGRTRWRELRLRGGDVMALGLSLLLLTGLVGLERWL